MSVAELKEQVDQLSAEDQYFLAAYLHHKLHANEKAEAEDLEERMRQMDGGDKVLLRTFLRIHEDLAKAGV